MLVKLSGKSFHLSEAFDWGSVDLIRGFPDRRTWVDTKRVWSITPSLSNLDYLREQFPGAEWEKECIDIYESKIKAQAKREKIKHREISGDLEGVEFSYPPMEHQKVALLLGRDEPCFAYFMDQGTGKTKVILDDIAHNWREGKVTAAIVFCPNSVKSNWDSEITEHIAPDVKYNKVVWSSHQTKDKLKELYSWRDDSPEGNLKIIVINIEAIRISKLSKFLEPIFDGEFVFIAIDESTSIKNPSAIRTKKAIEMRKNCRFARIATGTPIIKSPLNIYAQLRFLDADILGFNSFYAFRNRYAVMGGYGNYEILQYNHLDELTEKIKGCSYRVEKDDCLDLPPKTYTTRFIEMDAKQKKAYKEMKKNNAIFIENYTKEKGILTAPIKLTLLLRLQQITSSFLPVVNELGEVINTAYMSYKPKIKETISIIEECSHKVIVFARFKPEIYELKRILGERAVVFTGDQGEDDRLKARELFQDPDSEIDTFLATQGAGGIGINLFQARTVIYISNSFGTEHRVQSEDRAHRIGQKHSVEYIDLKIQGTVDDLIVDTLKENKSISVKVMEDKVNSWI